MPRTGFVPLQHGFYFTNSFPNPLAGIKVKGRCGGMAYIALDNYYSNTPIPLTPQPSEEIPLGRSILLRLGNSLLSQGGTFVRLLIPGINTDASLFGWSVSEADELGRLRHFINNNRPVPLGLISVHADLLAHHQVVACGYDAHNPRHDLKVYIYDPNHPNTEITLKADAPNNRFTSYYPDGSATGEHWRMYFVDYGFQTSVAVEGIPNGTRQDFWKWCANCRGLFYSGNSNGRCPAGGAHDSSGSGRYVLVHTASPGFGQNNWKWCRKCEVLAFTGNGIGVCAAGGRHDHSGSSNYSLPFAGPIEGQDNWRYCYRCEGLANAANGNGICSAGGEHNFSRSGNYKIAFY